MDKIAILGIILGLCLSEAAFAMKEGNHCNSVKQSKYNSATNQNNKGFYCDPEKHIWTKTKPIVKIVQEISANEKAKKEQTDKEQEEKEKKLTEIDPKTTTPDPKIEAALDEKSKENDVEKTATKDVVEKNVTLPPSKSCEDLKKEKEEKIEELSKPESLKGLIEDFKPLSFEPHEFYVTNEEDKEDAYEKQITGVIDKLKKAGKYFDCAFSFDKPEAITWWSNAFNWKQVSGYNSLYKGKLYSQKDKDEVETRVSVLKDDKDQLCSNKYIRFANNWTPLEPFGKGEKFYNIAKFIQNLKFDMDMDENGEELDGVNISQKKNKAKINQGWLNLNPLPQGKQALEYGGKNGSKSYSLDCNAPGSLCEKPDTFFRRLQGCSMRTLIRGGRFSCISSAIKSHFITEIASKTGHLMTRTKGEVTNKETLAIKTNIVWTFVLGEILKRHDAQRSYNNYVRAINRKLYENKDALTLAQTAKYLKDIHDYNFKNLTTQQDSTKEKSFVSKAKLDLEIKKAIPYLMESLMESDKVEKTQETNSTTAQ